MIYQAGSAYRYGKAQNVVYLCSQPIREKGNDMTNAITEITIRMEDGTTKTIDTNDGMVLILGGRCAKAKSIEECSMKEILSAKGEITEAQPEPSFEDKLAVANEELQQSSQYKDFEAAVDFLTDLNADEFLEIVRYAEKHNNRFPRFVNELRNIVNANDAWGSAYSRLISVYSKKMQDKLHRLLDNCLLEDPESSDEDLFGAVWDDARNALATFNVL